MHIIIMIFVYSVLGMSFSMMYSVGRLSLGAGVFFAIGAYTSTLLTMNLGISFWLALPLTIIICVILSSGTGAVMVRSPGFSFAILTMLFSMAVVQLFGQFSFFGGWVGFFGIPAPNPIPIPFNEPIKFVGKTPYYYLILFLFFLIILSFRALYSSRIGRTWKAIQLSPHLAQTIGINLYKNRLLAFIISSAAVATVGCFFASYSSVISPDEFGGFFTINIMLYSVLGGLDFYILGPIIGASIVTFIPEFLRFANIWESIIMGIFTIVVIVLFYGGILGWLQRFRGFNIVGRRAVNNRVGKS